VPLDERAIAALANSPLALDVYAWLAQRLHRIPEGKPQRVSWKALSEHFGNGYTRLRAFRAGFLEVLALVHAQYRAAKVEADDAGLELRHSLPPVSARFVPVRKLLG
jgi:Plasmid encoded RepA protein